MTAMKWKLFGAKDDKAEEVPVKQKEEAAPLQDAYEDVLARLIAHARKNEAWVLVPVKKNGQVFYYDRKLTEVTPSDFVTWLVFVCPPLANYSNDVTSFENTAYRNTAFDLAVEYAKSIPEKWQAATRLATTFQKGLIG